MFVLGVIRKTSTLKNNNKIFLPSFQTFFFSFLNISAYFLYVLAVSSFLKFYFNIIRFFIFIYICICSWYFSKGRYEQSIFLEY